MVKRSTPTVAVLTNLYNIINETIQDKDAYYTDEQIDNLRKDPNNNFLQLNKKGAANGNSRNPRG